MKRQFLSFAILLSIMVINSGRVAAQCTPADSANPGIYQNNNVCFVSGEWVEQVWQFKNYEYFSFAGNNVQIQQLQIDSITNLPAGLHWTTSQMSADTPNLFQALQTGCFTIYGQTSDDTGLYLLDVYVTVWLVSQPTPIPEHLGYVGDTLYIRVIDSGQACLPFDSTVDRRTSSNSAEGDIPRSTSTGINDIEPVIGNLGNYPNPFNGSTQIMFASNGNKQMTLRVYDLLGNTLYAEQINAVGGRNIVDFNRNGLSSGIYFYSISDGKETYTNKMVITE